MTWRKRNLSTYSRYNVEVSTTKIEESSLLQNKSTKGLAYSVVKKFSALVTVVMIMVVAFSGMLTTAPDAKAWGVSDIVKDAQNALCATSPLGYKTDDKGFQAPKTPKNKKKMTAYEKYGMSGTSFSTWSGFNPEKGGGMDEANGNGEGPTRGIISATGGNAKKTDGETRGTNMVEWGEKWKDKESEFPGLFNLTGECGGTSFRSMGSIGANLIFSVAKVETWIAGFSYEAAGDINSTIFKTMEKPVNKIVKTLKDKLYFAYLTPIIMIGALWMAWVGLVKRQTTQVLSGIIWMIGAVAASVAMMTSPMMLPKLVNDTVGGISANAMGVITSAGAGNGEGELCYAPATKGESKSTNSVRTVQCNLWYSFVYTPFSLGQFGHNPKELTKHEAKDPKNSLKGITAIDDNNIIYEDGSKRFKEEGEKFYALKNPTGGGDTKFARIKLGDDKVVDASEQNFALAWIDFKSNWDNNPTLNYTKTSSLVNIAVNQLSPENYNADFRGDNVGNRVTMALVALVSASASSLMIIVLSIALIILDLGLIILALVFPLFALAALHPGEGRRIAMGWVELVCKIALRRIVGSVYLATLILVFSVLVTAGLAWAMSMILMIAIAVAGLVYYKKIDGAFSSFSLGGKPMEMPGAQAGEKMKQGLKSNALAAATGGRMGNNSLLGRSLQQAQQTKQWDKRFGGGAGNAPQSKEKSDNTNSSANTGAGKTPTRKELREAQRAEARERTLNGSNSNPELEDGNAPMGGAGQEPQSQEVDAQNQIPQAELEGHNYNQETEGYEVGAGEEPQAREIDENDVPTAELPEGLEQEQAQESINAGAGEQPQSYREQVTAHSGYEGSAIARKDARIEKNKQKVINAGNKVGEKIAPIARNAKDVASTHAGIGKFYATNSAREFRDNNLTPIARSAKEMASTGKFYAVNSVRELRDNLKNGVQGQVRVAQNKAGQITEAQKNKRIDKQLNKIRNGKAFEGVVYNRRHAEADVNKQMAQAKARRERIMAPVKAVGTSTSNIVARQATVAGNTIASGASVAGSKVTNATQAGANVVRVRATQGMEATREKLSQIPESVKNKTVVAYQENRAVKKLDKLNLADVKREHKADQKQFRNERKEMRNDIASQPRALRAQYAEKTYGTNAKGNAINAQAPAIAKSYVPPAIRAQEARVQEKQVQEKQALKEQKNAGGTQQPQRPVNSAPRPVGSAPKQPAPQPVQKANPVSAPRPVDSTPKHSAPRPVDAPKQSAPQPVKKANPASRPVETPKQSTPQPVKKANPASAPRPVDSTPKQSAPQPVKKANPASAPRPVDSTSKQSAPQPVKKANPVAPATPNTDRSTTSKSKVEPKQPTGSDVRPGKEVKPKNDTVPPRVPLSRLQGNTQAPQVPPRNPLNKGKNGK